MNKLYNSCLNLFICIYSQAAINNNNPKKLVISNNPYQWTGRGNRTGDVNRAKTIRDLNVERDQAENLENDEEDSDMQEEEHTATTTEQTDILGGHFLAPMVSHVKQEIVTSTLDNSKENTDDVFDQILAGTDEAVVSRELNFKASNPQTTKTNVTNPPISNKNLQQSPPTSNGRPKRSCVLNGPKTYAGMNKTDNITINFNFGSQSKKTKNLKRKSPENDSSNQTVKDTQAQDAQSGSDITGVFMDVDDVLHSVDNNLDKAINTYGPDRAKKRRKQKNNDSHNDEIINDTKPNISALEPIKVENIQVTTGIVCENTGILNKVKIEPNNSFMENSGNSQADDEILLNEQGWPTKIVFPIYKLPEATLYVLRHDTSGGLKQQQMTHILEMIEQYCVKYGVTDPSNTQLLDLVDCLVESLPNIIQLEKVSKSYAKTAWRRRILYHFSKMKKEINSNDVDSSSKIKSFIPENSVKSSTKSQSKTVTASETGNVKRRDVSSNDSSLDNRPSSGKDPTQKMESSKNTSSCSTSSSVNTVERSRIMIGDSDDLALTMQNLLNDTDSLLLDTDFLTQKINRDAEKFSSKKRANNAVEDNNGVLVPKTEPEYLTIEEFED